jgi:hypothetical protein
MPLDRKAQRTTVNGCLAYPLLVGMGGIHAPGSPAGDRVRPGRSRHLVGRQDARGSNCEPHHRRAL